MSTLEEIKAAVAELLEHDLEELARWLDDMQDRRQRRDWLRREIQVGLDQRARGEVAPLDIQEILKEARADWEKSHRV